MILCNLSNVLAEKRTNISKVSRDTGISRTTLTSLCNNTCQGVQFDTVNTLCQKLDISPEQLFLYSKYDIWVRSDMPYFEIENFPAVNSGGYNFIIECAGKKLESAIACTIYFHYEKNYINWLEVEFEWWNEDDNTHIADIIANENRILRKLLSELTPPLKLWLRNEIESRIQADYDIYLIDGYELSVHYPDEFK